MSINQNELLNKLLPDRRKVELETLYDMWANALSYFVCVLGGFSGYCRYLCKLSSSAFRKRLNETTDVVHGLFNNVNAIADGWRVEYAENQP